MKIRPIKTRIFAEGENLAAFITEHVPRLKNGSILVVTSKIVALAEERVVCIRNKTEKDVVIRKESEWAKRTKYVWLTMKDGMLLANAGVDESNAGGKLILLPKDSFRSAQKLRRKLQSLYKVKRLGVIITDSRVLPNRAGVVALALGYAGFKGLRDYRGKYDIFGRMLKFTQTNVADSLATSAALAMGEGCERQPLAVITEAPAEFSDRISRGELRIQIEDDMYRPLFRKPSR